MLWRSGCARAYCLKHYRLECSILCTLRALLRWHFCHLDTWHTITPHSLRLSGSEPLRLFGLCKRLYGSTGEEEDGSLSTLKGWWVPKKLPWHFWSSDRLCAPALDSRVHYFTTWDKHIWVYMCAIYRLHGKFGYFLACIFILNTGECD